MKIVTRIVILAAVAAIVTACQSGRYAAGPNEELYGIWISDRSPEKIVMHRDGTYENYLYKNDASPWGRGLFTIFSKKEDGQGNIWYQIDYLMKRPGDAKVKGLGRIEMPARIWEFVDQDVGSLEKDPFPTELDKKHSGYRVYRWEGPE